MAQVYDHELLILRESLEHLPLSRPLGTYPGHQLRQGIIPHVSLRPATFGQTGLVAELEEGEGIQVAQFEGGGREQALPVLGKGFYQSGLPGFQETVEEEDVPGIQSPPVAKGQFGAWRHEALGGHPTEIGQSFPQEDRISAQIRLSRSRTRRGGGGDRLRFSQRLPPSADQEQEAKQWKDYPTSPIEDYRNQAYPIRCWAHGPPSSARQ